MVSWTSSWNPEYSSHSFHEPIFKPEIAKKIESGILLPPDKTLCYIPAGIFKTVGEPTITITALGADREQYRDGIKTYVTVRSTATAMLGSGMMEAASEDSNDVDEENRDKQKDSQVDSEDPDAIDEADEAIDDAEKAKDLLNRAKDLLKF